MIENRAIKAAAGAAKGTLKDPKNPTELKARRIGVNQEKMLGRLRCASVLNCRSSARTAATPVQPSALGEA